MDHSWRSSISFQEDLKPDNFQLLQKCISLQACDFLVFRCNFLPLAHCCNIDCLIEPILRLLLIILSKYIITIDDIIVIMMLSWGIVLFVNKQQ